MAKMSKARTARIVLPQSPEAFEELITVLMQEYDLLERSHVKAVVSVAIRRLPADTGYVTLQFLANNVRNSVAKHVATHISNTVQHESQIDLVVQQITADPLDQQARDQLEAAASAGSEYAKAAMRRLGMEPTSNVDHPELAHAMSQSDVKRNVP